MDWYCNLISPYTSFIKKEKIESKQKQKHWQWSKPHHTLPTETIPVGSSPTNKVDFVVLQELIILTRKSSMKEENT